MSFKSLSVEHPFIPVSLSRVLSPEDLCILLPRLTFVDRKIIWVYIYRPPLGIGTVADILLSEMCGIEAVTVLQHGGPA
jgi:hypothetical protein